MADIFAAFEGEPKARKHLPTIPGRADPAPYSLQKLAKTHTEAALDTILGIMHDEDAEASTRLEAAKQVLDRGWGKAAIKQEIESRHINVHETLKVLAAQVQRPLTLVREEDVVDAIEVNGNDS
jgi:hypothetical protein